MEFRDSRAPPSVNVYRGRWANPHSLQIFHGAKGMGALLKEAGALAAAVNSFKEPGCIQLLDGASDTMSPARTYSIPAREDTRA